MTRSLLVRFCALVIVALFVIPALAQNKVTYTDQEKAIVEQVRELRQVPDDQRGAVTRKLAVEIRALSFSPGKLQLASGLGSLATEGDFGHDTLQEVTNTITDALREAEKKGGADENHYRGLARLVRYEGTTTSLSSAQYSQAVAYFEAADRARASADFMLTDLQGKRWAMKDLKGKVLLLNFWATWCPPCRKEIADLEALYSEYKGKGLVILGVADDDVQKLKDYAAKEKINYPVLPDIDRKVHNALQIEGIPATLIYDRNGKLAAQAVDMRTREQFVKLLAKAGLE